MDYIESDLTALNDEDSKLDQTTENEDDALEKSVESDNEDEKGNKSMEETEDKIETEDHENEQEEEKTEEVADKEQSKEADKEQSEEKVDEDDKKSEDETKSIGEDEKTIVEGEATDETDKQKDENELSKDEDEKPKDENILEGETELAKQEQDQKDQNEEVPKEGPNIEGILELNGVLPDSEITAPVTTEITKIVSISDAKTSFGKFGLRHSRKSKNKESTVKNPSFSKQRSIAYDFGPRFKDDTELSRISAQFGFEGEGDGDDTSYPYLGADEQESEEESFEEEDEEEMPLIDRDEYYKRYDKLQDQMENCKIESNLLQRKLATFFKRRKMEHVLRESAEHTYDTTSNYHKCLNVYKQTVNESSKIRSGITSELNALKNKRDNKLQELNQLFKSMQEREKEIGFGLIHTKTGKPIPDKYVERLINRQRIQMEQVSVMRLKYIVLKDLLTNKQQAIADLDNIGDGLRLRDYEQLKVENRSYADKLEERDEELTRLRFKCQNTIQILAHIREKSSALDADIDDLKEEMHSAETESFGARERLNSLKHERDQTRITIDKMRMESGLLAEPTLLRDMQNSMAELTAIKAELEHLKTENKIKAQQIRNIRKNIELASEEMTKNKNQKDTVIKKKKSRIFLRSRPSILKPTLPLHAFDHLKEHQSQKQLPQLHSSFKL